MIFHMPVVVFTHVDSKWHVELLSNITNGGVSFVLIFHHVICNIQNNPSRLMLSLIICTLFVQINIIISISLEVIRNAMIPSDQ